MAEDGLYRGDIVDVLRKCTISSCRRTERGKLRYVAEGKTLDGIGVAVVVEIGDAEEEVLDLLVITVWTIQEGNRK